MSDPNPNDIAGYEQRLGALLIERGKLTPEELERARRLRSATDAHLGALLVKLGLVSERDVAEGLAALLGLPLAAATDYPQLAVGDDLLSPRFLKHHQLLPLSRGDRKLVVAMADPLNRFAVDAIEIASGLRVSRRVGVPSEIEAAFDRLHGSGKTQMDRIVERLDSADDTASKDEVEHLKDLASEAPVVRLVNLILQQAVERRASDIHIEPFERQLRVRFRVDGVLRKVEAPPAESTAAVISRIKIMAKLNIAERRLPQDGRMKLHLQGKELDLRVSTLPTLYGESVVMRLLDKGSLVLDFSALGFAGDMLERFLEVLALPHGIMLVTGPTGSGKTTTLYAALSRLNQVERKIVSVEDPVEYQLDGINQVQVKPRIDLTFANALRAIVRQDPDVIMIGEMRDLETVRIALQAALTGHLVLSTLHTNDAVGSISRLLDMGAEDYLLTSTLNGILAQRLVRILCPACREAFAAPPEAVAELQLARYTDATPICLYRPVGCERCGGTGYSGRRAILELLVLSDPIRRLVLGRAGTEEILRAARREGMRPMYEDGLRKALAGETTVEEVLRVTSEM